MSGLFAQRKVAITEYLIGSAPVCGRRRDPAAGRASRSCLAPVYRLVIGTLVNREAADRFLALTRTPQTQARARSGGLADQMGAKELVAERSGATATPGLPLRPPLAAEGAKTGQSTSAVAQLGLMDAEPKLSQMNELLCCSFVQRRKRTWLCTCKSVAPNNRNAVTVTTKPA